MPNGVVSRYFKRKSIGTVFDGCFSSQKKLVFDSVIFFDQKKVTSLHRPISSLREAKKLSDTGFEPVLTNKLRP